MTETSRRGFIGGLVAFAALRGLPLNAATAEYYRQYIDGIAAKIRANADRGARTGFFFYTDPHLVGNRGQSGYIIADLISRTGLKRVFCGGDYSVMWNKDDPQGAVERTCRLHREKWRDPIEAAGGRLLAAKGNHDLLAFGKKGPDGKSASFFSYPSARVREILMDTAEAKRATGNPKDPDGVYCYSDDPEAKIRYIVADTSDGVRTDESKSPWIGIKMRKMQLEWMERVAFGTMPNGWRAVVFQHVPMAMVTIGRDEYIKRFTPFRELLEREASAGRLIADLSGHHHPDRFTFWNGLLHVSVGCDLFNDSPQKGSPFCGTLPERKWKSVSEQLVDCFQIGEEKLFATRIGFGHDRVYHLKVRKMKVGERLYLNAEELKGAVAWHAFDSDYVKEDKSKCDAASGRVQFRSTRLQVGSDGTLRALKPGSATVVALDASLGKEIFGVEIT